MVTPLPFCFWHFLKKWPKLSCMESTKAAWEIKSKNTLSGLKKPLSY